MHLHVERSPLMFGISIANALIIKVFLIFFNQWASAGVLGCIIVTTTTKTEQEIVGIPKEPTQSEPNHHCLTPWIIMV